MKKILLLALILVSVSSFADYELDVKFTLLEGSFVELLNKESEEHDKILNKLSEIQEEINLKKNYKEVIEERIEVSKSSNMIKYFRDDYMAIMKEYRELLTNVDSEIKQLNNKLKEYSDLIQLKRGGK